MFTYRTLTTQQYVNTVVDVISKTEGHLSQVTDLKDGMSTIGYGYTFERNDNIALWQAAGITLTTSEWTRKNGDGARLYRFAMS